MVKVDLRCKCGARWSGNAPPDVAEMMKEQFLRCHKERGCKVHIVSPSNTGSHRT